MISMEGQLILKGFCLQIVLTLAVTITAVVGYSTGAPNFACSSMTPGHLANTASGPVPFSVNISSLNHGYLPGQTYTIVLSGSSSNADFRGFLIQGRTMTNAATGTFVDNGDDQQLRCSNSAVTHMNSNEKKMVELRWTAPQMGTGTVSFRYAFVDMYTRYWPDQTTSTVKEACPIKGQIRKQCASHPDCHQTCNTTEPVACPAACIVNGCECPNGTVIDETIKQCVAPIECTGCPIKGQIRKECASHPDCHQACNTTEPTVCPAVCIVNGCECPNGTVIDETRKHCIASSECTACPIKGQIRKECASHPDCHQTCNTTEPVACPAVCIASGCECPNETVIDETIKECVASSKCAGNACNIKRISGKAKYRNNKRRLILNFSSNRQGKEARFLCQIDDQPPTPCSSPMKWRNLTLEPGEHSVTVNGSCIYNSGVTSFRSREFLFQVRN